MDCKTIKLNILRKPILSQYDSRQISSLLISAITFICLCILLVGLYWSLEKREEANIQRLINVQAKSMLIKIDTDMQKRVQSLQRIVDRWQVSKGTSQLEFEQDIAHYIIDDPGYQAIEWVDRTFHVRWVKPVVGNEEALGLYLGFKEKRLTALKQARDKRLATVTAPIALVQGGQGFLIYNPIFIDNIFDGFVLAVIRTDKWLERFSEQSAEQTDITNFSLQVSMDGQTIFQQNEDNDTIPPSSKATASSVIFERLMEVQLRPTSHFIKGHQTALPKLILLVCLMLSFLISTVIYLYRQQKSATTESLNANYRLKTEIIERKKTEALLAQERQKLRYILEGTDVGTWEWNMQTGETSFNERWASIVGYTLEELAPISIETWYRLVHPDDGEGSAALLEKNFTKELDYYEYEARMLHKNGDWIWVLDRGRVVKWDSDGSALIMAGTHQEVTQRKEVELATQEARTAAEDLANSKSLFLATMSHEIRTPMNGIIGLSELALNQTMSKNLRDYLLKILESSQGLLGILNDILNFSKLEIGHVSLENLTFTLDSILDSLRHTFSEKALAKSIQFVIDIDTDVPRDLIGDELRLRQILFNLTSNAIKFTNKGQVTISISLQRLQNNTVSLHFAVSDTGMGIDHNGINKLFKPFSQVDSSITRRFGGTGLGLAISHDLLKIMGGEFTVISEPDRGSNFSFELNFELATPTRRRNEKRKNKKLAGVLSKQLYESASSITGAEVLVVEDNEINQIVVTELLALAGIRCTIANHGREALDIMQTHSFDAVLMDMQMPVMGGIEATTHIRQNPDYVNLPVIALTAGITQEEKDSCLAFGMNDFLTKPVNSEVIIACLTHWINLNRKNEVSSVSEFNK
ncbi:MAG: PAS domain S-box-containing protein [Glaciecola sp.]